MDASIIVPIPGGLSVPGTELSGSSIEVIRGLSNHPPTIARLLVNVGPSVVTFGRVVEVADDYGRFLKLTAHSPAFDAIRDRLSDLYRVRAFPLSPSVSLARLRDGDAGPLKGIDAGQFQGRQMPLGAVVISDEQAWYQYLLPLGGGFNPDDLKSYRPEYERDAPVIPADVLPASLEGAALAVGN